MFQGTPYALVLSMLATVSTVANATEPMTPVTAPLSFIENQGQWPEHVKFATAPKSLRAIVERTALTLVFPVDEAPSARSQAAIRLSFMGALSEATLEGEARTVTRYGFFRGPDPSRWRAGAVSYSSVVYRCLYDGIDLRLRGAAGDYGPIEYDVFLAPGADLDQVVVRCDGAEAMLDEKGGLLLVSPFGTIVQPAPMTWAELAGGVRQPLACTYRVLDPHTFTFAVEGWNSEVPVVIDPRLTFLGGGGDDGGYAACVGPDGSIFVAGENGSFDVPVPPEQFGVAQVGGQDAFVAKFDPMLRELLWVANLGSFGTDRATDLAVAADGTVTVVGYTGTDGFPVTADAFGTSYRGGREAFVARLNPDPFAEAEDQLLYSTLIAGTGDEVATGVALEADGHALVVGSTSSLDFPTVPGAFDRDYNGGVSDAFLCRILLSQDASAEEQLLYSTYLGGSGDDCHRASDNIYVHMFSPDVCLDAEGGAIVAGMTSSGDFPTTPGAIAENGSGDFDAFVSRIRPNPSLEPGDQLTRSTYFGGSGVDKATWVDEDPSGNVVIGGWSSSGDLPVTQGPLGTSSTGASDTFVACLGPALDQTVHCALLGGSGHDLAMDGVVDSDGSIAFCGVSFSGNFPTTPATFQSNLRGNRDAFLARVDFTLAPERRLLACTLLGGAENNGWDEAWGITLASPSVVVLTGYTGTPDFVSGGDTDVYDRTYGGISDFFVASFDMRWPVAAFSLEPVEGTPPVSVSVDATASETPEGTDIVTYSWDFGDGTTGQGITASHTYADPGRYAITLTVTNSVERSATTTRSVTVFCPAGGDISPWTAVDIGEPAFPGATSSTGGDSKDPFVICSGGHVLVGSNDQCHFVYQETTDDVVLSAHVLTAEGAGGSWQVGVMLRESLDATARHASMVVRRSSELATPSFRAFRREESTTRSTGGGTVELPNAYVRIERRGDAFIALASTDGSEGSYVEVKRVTIPGFPRPYLAGLVAIGRDLLPESFRPLSATVLDLTLDPRAATNASFRRSDSNADGAVDIADAVFTLHYLFTGGPEPVCLDSADTDDNGALDITDAVYVLNFLFLGGPPPESPYAECGPDATEDELTCESFAICEEARWMPR